MNEQHYMAIQKIRDTQRKSGLKVSNKFDFNAFESK